MRAGVILTDRDRALLRGLYNHAVLSTGQIGERYFPGLDKSTFGQRLKKLTDARLIRKQNVGIVLYQGREKRIQNVYQITRRGIERLKDHEPDAPFRDEPVPIPWISLPHDLILSDTLAALEKRFPHGRWVHRRLIQGKSQEGERVPDAVYLGPPGEPKLALELELTAKSERQYRQVILSYRLDRKHSNVLYVTSRKGIETKLKWIITGRKEVAGLPAPDTGKFYFATLSNLLVEPHHARITNGSQPLVLDEERSVTL